MSSINASLSGIRANQFMLNVIGNNLANSSTNGFKASSVTFADMMSQTLQEATSGTSTVGGTNPIQVGLGVVVGAVTPNFSQGALTETGNPLDLAMDGNGFLALSDGSQTVFTRSAGFSVDAGGQLVDSQNGYRLLGTDNNPITIPYNVQIPAQQTATITLAGNLSSGTAVSSGEVLSTTTAFATSSGPATASTDLSALTGTSTAYANGDTIVISGADASGQAITPVNFTYGASNDGVTLGDLITKINSAFSGQATASLDASGNLVLTADQSGAASLSLAIAAGTGTGVTDWTQNAISVKTPGVAGGGAYHLSANIYDSLGNSHVLSLTFARTDANSWNMTAKIDDPQATLTQGMISGIQFNTDGSFNTVAGGAAAQQLVLDYGTAAKPQTIALSFGSASGFNGLTMFGGNSTAAATNQDGYSSGTLSTYNIGKDGVIQGIYTNGTRRTLAQIQTATFANPDGLATDGNGVWKSTMNSGDPVLGAATAGSTGSIASGAVEGSNVDAAQELSMLIIAQNNYELNARAMAVSNQVIQQLTQIIA